MEKVKIVKGVVDKIEHSVSEYQGRTQGTRRKFHVASLLIGSRWIRFESSKPLDINQGKRVAVAGIVRDRTLDALACRNFTTGAAANTGTSLWIIAGVAFSGSGAVILSMLFLALAQGKGIGVILGMLLFSGGMFLFGGLTLYVGIRTLLAAAALHKEEAPRGMLV